MTVGYRCARCGAEVEADALYPWRCPNATAADRAHVLRIVDDGPAWRQFALARGMDRAAADALVDEVDAAVAAVDGVGFHVTPFGRADALSDALGFAPAGGVWVKDETGNVAGSHKGRHLFGILLHLLAAERTELTDARQRRRLAIASCGNAALAAATLAAAWQWPIDVFVPPGADPWVLARLGALGAAVVLSPRQPADAPGDPCIHRFRDAVAGGAIPFSVQGPENALCLDLGRTLAWEMGTSGVTLDRVFVQVGGGALATCVADGLGPAVRLHAVQTEGCAPLARAWASAEQRGVEAAITGDWSTSMWPWEAVPHSAATGILDDETYDWVGVTEGMARSGGSPIVVPEALVVDAEQLARRTTGIDVDATGSAGLAGLLAVRRWVADDERVAVVFTGRRRSAP